MSERCPTCNMDWLLNPPIKCRGSNHFRCVECKAVYSGEMLAAPDMLAVLKIARAYVAKMLETVKHCDDPVLAGSRADFAKIEAAIAKAEYRP